MGTIMKMSGSRWSKAATVLGLVLTTVIMTTGLVEGSFHSGYDPAWDHQNTTYVPRFSTWLSQNADLEIAPIFSPEWSTANLTQLVEQVPDDGFLDIGTPHWKSWIGCTDEQHENGTTCKGCDIEKQRNNETFPIFAATLNAVHRGVRVRILTNDWGDITCNDQIRPLDFLYLNKVDIRFYRTTTVWHSKYINANGKKIAISSINFSQTSFVENREAGFILSGNDIDAVNNYVSKVFDYDWNLGIPYKLGQNYSQDQMKEITDPEKVPLPEIPFPRFNGSYITPTPEFHKGPFNTSIYVNPDTSRKQLFTDLDNTKSSFQLYIYEITDLDVCYKILDRHRAGVNVSVLVSNYIVGHSAQEKAKECYEALNNYNCKVRQSPYAFTFAHQKYWIMDDTTVALSTGNMSPSDIAFNITRNNSYPPQPDSDWQEINRDMNVKVESESIVQIFKKTFTEDWWRGSWW